MIWTRLRGSRSLTGSLVTDSSAPHGATLPDPSFSGSNFFPPDPNYWQHFMSNTLAVDQKLDRILNLFYEHKQKVNSDTLEMKEGIESLKGELQFVKNFADISSSSSSNSTPRQTSKLPTDLSVSLNEKLPHQFNIIIGCCQNFTSENCFTI